MFTTPHLARIEGHVRSTKPLSYQGTLIKDIAVEFEAGRIVHAQASAGLDVLEKVLGTDEGARRLGEVALVPHSSPISAAACSSSTPCSTRTPPATSPSAKPTAPASPAAPPPLDDELARRGANSSLIHIDWMIGSGEIDVDGILPGGTSEPVMRLGEWV